MPNIQFRPHAQCHPTSAFFFAVGQAQESIEMRDAANPSLLPCAAPSRAKSRHRRTSGASLQVQARLISRNKLIHRAACRHPMLVFQNPSASKLDDPLRRVHRRELRQILGVQEWDHAISRTHQKNVRVHMFLRLQPFKRCYPQITLRIQRLPNFASRAE